MTKSITISIPHELGKAEARRRIDDGFSRLTSQFGGAASNVEKVWEADRLSFSLRALGQAISGRMDVEDALVRLEVDVPAFLAMIADKLKGRLKKEGQLLLEKKK
ncbi:MAG: polyhydroxyalkanoic acid system family protein [Phenylobacterium sp.]|uniref:polyhydroxyalkanoic acid system family protein n=1 Tax=Phenylobacterium sp. TaxID=1871053 RepID=UPI00273636E6|nr:polyhydroxyalkanoic acid system family protein [Phenylobacterium sp.]MDP3174525.1 polyhydroxyalkanoic acid system family protein [Phenylobacterium sp.]